MLNWRANTGTIIINPVYNKGPVAPPGKQRQVLFNSGKFYALSKEDLTAGAYNFLAATVLKTSARRTPHGKGYDHGSQGVEVVPEKEVACGNYNRHQHKREGHLHKPDKADMKAPFLSNTDYHHVG